MHSSAKGAKGIHSVLFAQATFLFTLLKRRERVDKRRHFYSRSSSLFSQFSFRNDEAAVFKYVYIYFSPILSHSKVKVKVLKLKAYFHVNAKY